MADGLEILQLKLYLYEFSNVLARLNSTLFLLKAKWNLLFHFSGLIKRIIAEKGG